MRRSLFLLSGAAMLAACTATRAAAGPQQQFAVSHTDAEWQRILGPDRFAIMRRDGTEPPYSSPLNNETRTGLYSCAGCNLALFESKWKYDAGEGWPSFWTVRPNATKTRDDYELVEQRTEVHCARCGGHLGHIFDDGPAPTHLRYCIDGLALKFSARGA